MRKYSKFIVVAGSLAALAVPSAAMASQPTNPGGFGQDRAAGVHLIGGSTWGQIASQGGGDPANGNALNNALYKQANSDLPVEAASPLTP